MKKTVYVDGKMSKADWMTGLAAIIGILGDWCRYLVGRCASGSAYRHRCDQGRRGEPERGRG